MDRLEHELADTRERLQITIEEYETSVEELKSANEELQSTNEELQSTNEELETTKEEMQSLNEELQTVNAQLARKVEEADRASSDLRHVFESTEVGTVFLDDKLVIRSFTPAATEIFNLIASDTGRPLTDIASQVNLGDLQRDIETVADRGERIERRVRRRDGTAHYLMRILPCRKDNDEIDGVLVTFVDVTTLVEAEEHQRVLVAELNHRVRNMLTVVIALAKQTLSGDPPTQEMKQAFIGRIQAMADSYSLISRENWQDVPLREILHSGVDPYDDGSGRVTIEGPAMMCRPATALSLTMVVHELATNAVKYGALSRPDGRIAISWSIERNEQARLVLEWREASSRSVEPPTHKGLGTKMIERQLKAFPGATAELEYPPEGLQARFTIPLGTLMFPAWGESGG